MAQQRRSEHSRSKRGSEREVQRIGFYSAWAALPFTFILGLVPVRISAGLSGVYAVILHVFQNHDRASTWLAFAIAWLACATGAVASAYLVSRVSETRKRLFDR